MGIYQVTIQESVTQVWEVEAEDEQAAEYFYDSGTLVFEKGVNFEVLETEKMDKSLNTGVDFNE